MILANLFENKNELCSQCLSYNYEVMNMPKGSGATTPSMVIVLRHCSQIMQNRLKSVPFTKISNA